jgi:hypothetical protein
MTGVPRRSARSRFDHIRRRSRQKSPDRAEDDDGLRARSASRPSGMVRHADLDDRSGRRRSSLISSSAEKNAPPDSIGDPLEGRSRRNSLQAQSTSGP